jgi:DNA-binding protein HU-beta
VTKDDVVNAVAARTGLSKKDARIAVEAVLESVKEALRDGHDVTFTGFGKFTVQNRNARTGTNPRSPGQKVTIPASTVPKFSAGSQLRAVVASQSPRGSLGRCRHGLPSVTGRCEH